LANFRANSTPTVNSSATVNSTVSVPLGTSTQLIDMAGHFTDPDLTNSQVTFNITNGTTPEALKVNLFDTTAPETVANFFDYVKAGDYTSSIFNRLVPGFVLQGGGATVSAAGSGSALTAIATNPPIPNEFPTGAAPAPQNTA